MTDGTTPREEEPPQDTPQRKDIADFVAHMKTAGTSFSPHAGETDPAPEEEEKPEAVDPITNLANIRAAGDALTGLGKPIIDREALSRALSGFININPTVLQAMGTLSSLEKLGWNFEGSPYATTARYMREALNVQATTSELYEAIAKACHPAQAHIRKNFSELMESITPALKNLSGEEQLEKAFEAVQSLSESARQTDTHHEREALDHIHQELAKPAYQEALHKLDSPQFTEIEGNWHDNARADIAKIIFDQWKSLYLEESRAAQHVDVNRVQALTYATIKDFLELFNTSLGIQETDDLGQPAHIMATGKITQNLSEIARDSIEAQGELISVSGGRSRATQQAFQEVGFHSPSGEPVEINEFDKRVIDTVGSFWELKHGDTQESGTLILRDKAIARHVLAVPSDLNVTDQQVADVNESIEKLRHIDFRVAGTDYRGQPLPGHWAHSSYAINAEIGIYTTPNGEAITGYQINKIPPSYRLERALGMTRIVTGLLSDRKGGWRPSTRVELSVYSAIARRLFMFRGSRFNHKTGYKISYRDMHVAVGQIYAPSELEKVNAATERQRRQHIRNVAERALQELIERGVIETWNIVQGGKSGRQYMAVEVYLPKEAPNLEAIEAYTREAENRRMIELQRRSKDRAL